VCPLTIAPIAESGLLLTDRFLVQDEQCRRNSVHDGHVLTVVHHAIRVLNYGALHVRPRDRQRRQVTLTVHVVLVSLSSTQVSDDGTSAEFVLVAIQVGARMAGAFPDGMPVFRGYQRRFLAIAPAWRDSQ
jgi:hypothetical protein